MVTIILRTPQLPGMPEFRHQSMDRSANRQIAAGSVLFGNLHPAV